MSQQTVPARTVYTCDRCNKREDRPEALKDWKCLALNNAEAIDICEDCVTKFNNFMARGIVGP